MAYVLFRGEYDKRRDPVKPDTPDVLPPMPADLPQQPARPRAVAAAARAPADGPRDGQPLLAGGLRHRPRPHGGRLRRQRRAAVASRAARLAGGRVPRVGLGREAVLQAAGHVGHLPPVGRGDAGEAREGPAEPAALARARGSAWTPRWSATTPWPPAACWSRKIGGPSVKPYQPDGVWEAVAMIGSNTRDYKRDSGESLYRRSLYTFWKRAAPPASMDIFNAPSREICTVRRERTEHAAAGAGDAQRPAVRRGGPAPGAARALKRRRRRPTSAASTSWPSGCWPGRSAPRRSQVVQASLDDLLAYYQAHPEDAAKLIAVGESKADAALDAADAGRLDDAGQRADEPGRGAEQVSPRRADRCPPASRPDPRRATRTIP